MVDGISLNSVNSMQLLSASNAFKASKSKSSSEESDNLGLDTQEYSQDLGLKSDFVTESKFNNFNSKSMDEIKNLAQKMDEDLSEDDIKYGIMYGRSVLVNYTA